MTILTTQEKTSTLIVILGLCGMLYLRTMRHLLSSRCTEINCCGMSLKRIPISEDNVIELSSVSDNQL
jgi:hypothetical protein